MFEYNSMWNQHLVVPAQVYVTKRIGYPERVCNSLYWQCSFPSKVIVLVGLCRHNG